jgi:antitoxin YefM
MRQQRMNPMAHEWNPCLRLTAAADLVILMTMTTMSLAEVKAHLSELVGRVSSQHERLTVTVHGRPSAVLLAVEDLESLEETIAVLSDTDALRELIEAEAEIARGEGESAEQLAEAMRRRRSTT